jgi:hypothetical protein
MTVVAIVHLQLCLFPTDGRRLSLAVTHSSAYSQQMEEASKIFFLSVAPIDEVTDRFFCS